MPGKHESHRQAQSVCVCVREREREREREKFNRLREPQAGAKREVDS
jgi:hypothetical protein